MIRNMVLKRIGSALLALLLSSVVIFLLVRLAPGDPINLVLGEGPGDIGVNTELLEERRESLREAHGLNDSIPVQYANWFKKIITLDMGTSIRSGRPITQELWSRVPATLSLWRHYLSKRYWVCCLVSIRQSMPANYRIAQSVCFVLSLLRFLLSCCRCCFCFYLLFGFIGMKLAAKWSGADCGCLQLH